MKDNFLFRTGFVLSFISSILIMKYRKLLKAMATVLIFIVFTLLFLLVVYYKITAILFIYILLSTLIHIIKLIDMIYHAYFIHRQSKDVVLYFRGKISEQEKLYAEIELIINNYEAPIMNYCEKLDYQMGITLFAILFRYPTTMCLISAMILVINYNTCLINSLFWLGTFQISIIMSALLIAGILVEILVRTVYHYELGPYYRYIGFYRGELSFARKAPTANPKRNELLIYGASHFATRLLLRQYVVFLFIIIISYASIYNIFPFCPDILNSSSNCLHDSSAYSDKIITNLYFTIVTLATVGYGDIYPVGMVPRLIVTSEIVVGFIFIVLLLAAFSATISPEPINSTGRE